MRLNRHPFCAISVLAVPLLLAGCGVAGAATKVITAPVAIASKGVDLATTSQSEADEKRGREARKREERLGKLYRQREDLREDCYRDNDRGACETLREVDQEIADLSRY